MKTDIMQTKLGIFCDKLVEAGWLAAVIIVPLYFNIYLESVFEMGKACLLRSIALVMLLAWGIRTVEKWRSEKERRVEVDLVSDFS